MIVMRRDRVRDGHASRVGCGKEPLLYEHPSTLHIGTYVCVAHILAYGMWDPKHTPQRYIAADLTRNETAAVAIKVVVVEMEMEAMAVAAVVATAVFETAAVEKAVLGMAVVAMEAVAVAVVEGTWTVGP